MNYLFTNLIGSFVLDQNLKIIDQIPFKSLAEYAQSKEAESKLKKKHPQLQMLPQDKLPQVLTLFKEKKYFKEFHDKNIALTQEAVKDSVSNDNFIIQAIANIAELDKACNLLSKRLREWYCWYAPEISEKITNHEQFADAIIQKSKKELLAEFKIKESMGAEMEKIHVDEILLLAKQVSQLYHLRQQHEQYLEHIMKKYCPNLLELAGTTIGAKLMELSRGLKHLALLPASTIQLLGAEKALFRHITSGSKSPKYGVLFAHPLIQKARKEERGKAARMLADKLSLCARLDYFKGEFKAKEYKKELEEKFR
jgi:nucleolar protein 56